MILPYILMDIQKAFCKIVEKIYCAVDNNLIYTNGIISYHDIYHIMMGHVLSVSSTVKKKMHILHHDTNIYCELLSDVQGRDGLGRDPRTFEWRSRSVIDGHGRNPGPAAGRAEQF